MEEKRVEDIMEIREESFCVGTKNGLHMGPCTQLVRLSQSTGCEIRIGRKEEAPVCADSILTLITCAFTYGTPVKVSVHGKGTENVMRQVASIINGTENTRE